MNKKVLARQLSMLGMLGLGYTLGALLQLVPYFVLAIAIIISVVSWLVYVAD